MTIAEDRVAKEKEDGTYEDFFGNPLIFDVMIGCFNCGHWNKWHRDDPLVSFFLDKTKRICDECGQSEWNWHSITSLRTFDPVRAKRKSVKRKRATR